jgi:HlyD family secretion protein
LVKQGEEVQKGQLVAKIYDFKGIAQYKSLLSVVDNLKADVEGLEKQINTENLSQKESLQNQIAATKKSIEQLEQSIPPLENELKTKEGLLQQQLTSLNEVYEARQALSRQQIALATSKGTLASLQSDFVKSYRVEELREKKKELLQAVQESELLKDSLNYNEIYSPHAGRVLEILKSPGQHVTAGTPILRLEDQTDNKHAMLFYSYIPIEYGKRIHKNALARIDLSNISSGEFGSLLGKVAEVSAFPVSRDNVIATIQNEGIVDYFLTDPATNKPRTLLQVIIEPELDPTTPSGYKWTTARGPDRQISTGTVGVVNIVVDRVKPIYYFFSLWRFTRPEEESKSGNGSGSPSGESGVRGVGDSGA